MEKKEVKLNYFKDSKFIYEYSTRATLQGFGIPGK